MSKVQRTSELRSKIMRSVKSKNTGAELLVRKCLRNGGFYYRLHVKSLPGTPDIVFRKAKKAIFVNGCFWHGHNCGKGRLPKSNIQFWQDKIEKNTARDKRVQDELTNLGWKLLVVWQCETKNDESLKKLLQDFLTE